MNIYKKVTRTTKTNKGYEFIEYSDGSKHWFLNGKRHREDGPAFISSDRKKAWCLDGKLLLKEDFTIEMILKMNASELFTPAELAKMRLDSTL